MEKYHVVNDLLYIGKGSFTKDIIRKYGAYASHDNKKLDPLIVPILNILHQKGYETEFSCSGHYKPDIWVNKKTKQTRETYSVFIYILFHGLYRFNDIPKGFIEDISKPNEIAHYHRLSIQISNNNYMKLKKLKDEEALISNITKYLNSLLKWAKKLPEVK